MLAFGFLSKDLNSTPLSYNPLDCWKKKDPVPDAGHLSCPWRLFSSPCDYIDDYIGRENSEDECDYERV